MERLPHGPCHEEGEKCRWKISYLRGEPPRAGRNPPRPRSPELTDAGRSDWGTGGPAWGKNHPLRETAWLCATVSNIVAAGVAWVGAIDYLYIDADHSVEGCTLDLELWWPFLKVGGLIAAMPFTLPNTLEGALQRFAPAFAERSGCCYREARIMNVPWTNASCHQAFPLTFEDQSYFNVEPRCGA